MCVAFCYQGRRIIKGIDNLFMLNLEPHKIRGRIHDYGTPFFTRAVKGFCDIARGCIRGFYLLKACASGFHHFALINILRMIGGGKRRITTYQNHRQACYHSLTQGCKTICKARSLGDGRNTNLASDLAIGLRH